jgi:hypothetical protein
VYCEEASLLGHYISAVPIYRLGGELSRNLDREFFAKPWFVVMWVVLSNLIVKFVTSASWLNASICVTILIAVTGIQIILYVLLAHNNVALIGGDTNLVFNLYRVPKPTAEAFLTEVRDHRIAYMLHKHIWEREELPLTVIENHLFYLYNQDILDKDTYEQKINELYQHPGAGFFG